MEILEQNLNKIDTDAVFSRIVSVKDFLSNKHLTIPIYQRPYKWNQNNVSQLINDIKTFKTKPLYRFGTVVIHKDENKEEFNIVDGQQRSITILLVVLALIEKYKTLQERNDIKEELLALEKELVNFHFDHPVSQQNIYHNYQHIVRLVSDFDDQLVSFLLNKCQFIEFRLKDISEAFQFFDSQNSRGKDLDPHDLLKAYHLREFDDSENKIKLSIVNQWENADDSELAHLFSQYLYRIKGWSSAESARDFSKNEIYRFKGINIHELNQFPYSKSLRIIHHFVDDYNNSFHRKIDQTYYDFPFQLDQTIINGRRFFEMIHHYHDVFNTMVKTIKNKPTLNQQSHKILETIDSYDGVGRTGDAYTRLLFDTILIYYVDKFGENEINTAIQYFFIWAYNLRLSYQSLQFSSVDNYVLEHNMFKKIKDSFTPQQVLRGNLIVTQNPSSSKTQKIIDLFVEFNFIRNNVSAN
ncbi:DUF262 domain-containing protein [Flavobacterium sp.]|jgi:hypothetical protein|uniref:DUF262 domain-containing protein n=1 Tax=Flavobacterium sp. TaxID=239 RepID=UPI0037BF9457